MIDQFTLEETFINSKKNEFKALFGKEADENLDSFLLYLSNLTNRELVANIATLNKKIEELIEK